MDIWYWRLKSVQRKRINCGVCSVVINVICFEGFDLFNIDAISRNPSSTPNLYKCFTKLIDDDGWFIGNKRKNIQMIPFILISAHILLMSMFQISGSGRGSGWPSDNNFRNRIQESSSRSHTVRGPSPGDKGGSRGTVAHDDCDIVNNDSRKLGVFCIVL